MKEYCLNCCRLTEGINHFDCDNEGRVIGREISCAVCHRVRVVEHYVKPIPRLFSIGLLQDGNIRPHVRELAGLKIHVHYAGKCVTCGKEYTYDFNDERLGKPLYHGTSTQAELESLSFCSLECHKLFMEQRKEVEEIFNVGLRNRIWIGDHYQCFICGKTFQEVQTDKVRLQASGSWYTLQWHHIYGIENGLEMVRLCPGCHYDIHYGNIIALTKLVVKLGENGHKVDERRFASFYSLTSEQMQRLKKMELQYSTS